MERGFKGAGSFFFLLLVVDCIFAGWGGWYGCDVEGVFAEEYGAGFVVYLFVCSEDGCVEVVFCVLTGDGAFDGCWGDEKVCIDV